MAPSGQQRNYVSRYLPARGRRAPLTGPPPRAPRVRRRGAPAATARPRQNSRGARKRTIYKVARRRPPEGKRASSGAGRASGRARSARARSAVARLMHGMHRVGLAEDAPCTNKHATLRPKARSRQPTERHCLSMHMSSLCRAPARPPTPLSSLTYVMYSQTSRSHTGRSRSFARLLTHPSLIRPGRGDVWCTSRL